MKLSIATIVFLVAIVLMFVGASEPVIPPLRGTALEDFLARFNFSNSILFGISCNLSMAVLFWYIFVYRQDKERKANAKKLLRRNYKNFKEGLAISFIAGSEQDHNDKQLLANLLDYSFFRKSYLDNSNSEKWDIFKTNLRKDNYGIREVIMASICLFRTNIEHALLSLESNNSDSSQFFNDFIIGLFRISHLTSSIDFTCERIEDLVLLVLGRKGEDGSNYKKDDILENINNL